MCITLLQLFVLQCCVCCRVKAYHVYKEAVKYGYSNWNIWDNFLVVCYDMYMCVTFLSWTMEPFIIQPCIVFKSLAIIIMCSNSYEVGMCVLYTCRLQP